MFLLTGEFVSSRTFFREDHIARKVDLVVKEAKAKLAKGDKKGEYFLT